MTALGLGAALVAGVAGSAHCAVMCGGIATALGGSATVRRPLDVSGVALAFNGGRLLGYAGVGSALQFCVHSLGARIPGPDAGLWLRALATVVMAALAVRLIGDQDVLLVGRWGAWCWRRLVPLARPAMQLPQPYRSIALGMLWGLMPCGLVYSVLLVAASAPRPVDAASIMVVFGLGTLPALLGLSVAGTAGFATLRGTAGLRRVAGIVVLVCGLLTGWGALAQALGPEHDLGVMLCGVRLPTS